eukprot:scpid9175/ scgid3095/ Docking protein 1; Downstream of tyrosine kinase 1; p62(dok); pp62
MSRRSKDAVKEGFLAKCPQKEGLLKKWNRRFFVLFQQSSQETARLEYYDDEWSYARLENKRIIPLRECSPSGILQTHGDKNNPYVFDVRTPITSHRLAAPSQADLNFWLQAIKDVVEKCHAGGSGGQGSQGRSQRSSLGRSMTMPARRDQPTVRVAGHAAAQHVPATAMPSDRMDDFGDPFQTGFDTRQHGTPSMGGAVTAANQAGGPAEFGGAENSIYNSADTGERVRVRVKNTDASYRLGFSGDVYLIVTPSTLQLQHVMTDEILCSWPLCYIRRYGRDSKKFTFEAGRRCADVAGLFEFQTNFGDAIFKRCQDNIAQLHRDFKTQGVLPPGIAPPTSPTSAPSATVEFPQQPQPYRSKKKSGPGSTHVFDAVGATLPRPARQRTSLNSMASPGNDAAMAASGNIHPGAQQAAIAGPPKPMRAGRKASDPQPMDAVLSPTNTPTTAASQHVPYDKLKPRRSSSGMLSQNQPALIDLSDPSPPPVMTSDEVQINPYAEIPSWDSPSNTATTTAASTSVASSQPRPAVRTRTTAGGKNGSRPSSMQRGFDEVSDQMSALDRDLQQLSEQLEISPSTSRNTVSASSTTTPHAAAGDAPKPAGIPKRNPFARSPSMEEQQRLRNTNTTNPTNPFSPGVAAAAQSPTTGSPIVKSPYTPMDQPPIPVANSPYTPMDQPPIPVKKKKVKSPMSDKNADYEPFASPGAAAPPLPEPFASPGAAAPPLPEKKGSGKASGVNVFDVDYEHYEDPPLPVPFGKPQTPHSTPQLPSTPGKGHRTQPEEDTDEFGYTKHIRSGQQQQQQSGDAPPPAVPKPDYTTVRFQGGKGEVATPSATAGPHKYGNIGQTAVPDLSSVKLRKTDVSSDRNPAGSRNTPSASTNADSQQAARRQLNPFAPAVPAPMPNGDLFHPGTADPNQLTHTGYGNVPTAGQVAPNSYGNVPSSNLSPFDQLDNGAATEKPPPLPVDKPADMLTHTGYTNVNRDHSSMATPFDDAPPPPMPKPSNLAPLRAGGGGGGGGCSISCCLTLYPSTNAIRKTITGQRAAIRGRLTGSVCRERRIHR